jgi:hypothetical protein
VTFNHGVEGSSPSALTNKIKDLVVEDRRRAEDQTLLGATLGQPAFDFGRPCPVAALEHPGSYACHGTRPCPCTRTRCAKWRDDQRS